MRATLANTERGPGMAVVMACRNGAAHLEAQLRSLQWQTHGASLLIASDDGSTDATHAALARVPEHRLLRLHGPCMGAAANFLHGLRHVPDASMAAFCDQDDLWLPQKLERACAALRHHAGPAFYTSGRYVADHDLRPLCVQRRGTARFETLALRGVAAGHTMVMNAKAVTLLRQTMPHRPPAFHDWWASLVLLGCGARWIHDPTPTLLYRQHAANVIGARGGRLRRILDGTHKEWIRQTHAALAQALPFFQPGARAVIEDIRALRAVPLAKRPMRLACMNGRSALLSALALADRI